ncbi:MAG TPA: hypothetical protein DDW27_08340 [Bacteroidales bacterium]|nr:hypothetical protein [Bacteroidales bacterium]
MLLSGYEIKPANIDRLVHQLSMKYDPSPRQVSAWQETFRIVSCITQANRQFDQVRKRSLPVSCPRT